MTLAHELAVQAMGGGGRLDDRLSAAEAQEAARQTQPRVAVEGRRVRPARTLVRVAGEVPVRDGDGFRAATPDEERTLEDGLVGGVFELEGLGVPAVAPDRLAAELIGLWAANGDAVEQGLVGRDGDRTVLGELLVGSGLAPCVVEQHGTSLAEGRRASIAPDVTFSLAEVWPSLVDALPNELVGFGGDAPGEVVVELVRQLLVVALGNRCWRPSEREVPVVVRVGPREVEVEVPGGALRWVERGPNGLPLEDAHRNPRLVRWLRGLCADYAGAAGLAARASAQGFVLRWAESCGVVRVALERRPLRRQHAGQRPSTTEVNEALVIAALHVAGGEASAARLREHTGLSNSTQQAAINRLIARGVVAPTRPGAKPRGQTYVLCGAEEGM